MQIKLSDEKKKEIQDFLKCRFKKLKDLRRPIDDNVKKWDKQYDMGKDLVKEEWEYNLAIPQTYTVVNTLTAFTKESLFSRGDRKPVEVASEVGGKVHDANNIADYINSRLEQSKIGKKSFDIVQEAFKRPICWVQLIPTFKGKDRFNVFIAVHDWYDVWFDTKMEEDQIETGDFFIRTIKGFADLKAAEGTTKEKPYFDIDAVKDTTPDKDIINLQEQKYKTKTKTTYYNPNYNSNNDDVDVLTWVGRYNISDDPESYDLTPVMFALGNEQLLIRADTNELKTEKKIFMFPVVSFKESKSLMGKCATQLVYDMQLLINEAFSLLMDNFNQLVKMIFKYDRNAQISLSHIYSGGGNAIPVSDMKDIDQFEVKNILAEGQAILTFLLSVTQNTVGSPDNVAGSQTKGVETAREASLVAQNQLTKFNLISDTMKHSFIDIIRYVTILYNTYDKDNVRVTTYNVEEFVAMDEVEIEDDFTIDIRLKNMAENIELERTQFVNMANIVVESLQQLGGNPKALFRTMMEKFKVKNIDEILGGGGAGAITPEVITALVEKITGGGAGGAGAKAVNNISPESTSFAEVANKV